MRARARSADRRRSAHRRPGDGLASGAASFTLPVTSSNHGPPALVQENAVTEYFPPQPAIIECREGIVAQLAGRQALDCFTHLLLPPCQRFRIDCLRIALSEDAEFRIPDDDRLILRIERDDIGARRLRCPPRLD